MDNWLKWTLPIVAGAGLLASGGTLAPALAGLLGSEGAAAGAAGAAGAAEATAGVGAAAAGLSGGEAAAAGSAGLLGAAPEAAGIMAYTTPSVMPSMAGSLAGTSADYGTSAMLADAGQAAAAAPPPGILAQAGGYAKDAGKAASTYNAVSGAMGGNAPPRAAPQGRPVFQGEAPQIAQQQGGQPQDNQFARMLQEQRMRARGMLG